MANRYGIVILVAVLALLLPSSESVTTLVCGASVTTVNLNQVYATYTYPASGSYPTSTTCQWLFQTSDSSARITFTVTDIYVHCGDVLKFHDGTSASASAIGSSVCCSAPCGASKAAQTTTGNSLFVLFNTDSTTNLLESGFRVSIVVGKDESNCPTNGVNNTETLTAQTALTSPQFPARYPTSHVCTYTYTYTGGTVRLEFVYLDVELDSGTCFDYVEMYNGSSTSSPLIAKVCGSTLPTVTYTSTESSLTVKFSSDNQETKTGFYANIIPVAGGVQLTDSSKTGDNSGVIAAIVLSVIAIAALAVVVGFLFLKKRIKGGYSIGVDKKDADRNKDGGDSKQDRDTNDDNPNKSEMENKPPRSTAIN